MFVDDLPLVNPIFEPLSDVIPRLRDPRAFLARGLPVPRRSTVASRLGRPRGANPVALFTVVKALERVRLLVARCSHDEPGVCPRGA